MDEWWNNAEVIVIKVKENLNPNDQRVKNVEYEVKQVQETVLSLEGGSQATRKVLW